MWGWLSCVVALLVAGAPAVAAPPPPSEDSAPTSADAVPLCPYRPAPFWVTNASHPNDGTPDPEGRIVFGIFQFNHEIWGQVVALFAIDPDGSDLGQLLNCDVARPRFSPDGTRLAFTVFMDNRRAQVATMNVDGTDLRVLTTRPGSSETPDWSPDGSWLIYAHVSPDCLDPDCVLTGGVTETLWRIDADGANARQVGASDSYDFEPKLSPDGTEVVFTRYDPSRAYWYTLMIRDLATGAERRVTADETEPEHPEWSPDGASIIYNTLHAADNPDVHMEQIERVPSDDPSAQPEVLYPEGGGCCAYKPTYSPDGASIAFLSRNRLLRMNADGSGVTEVLVASGSEVNHVAWGRTLE